MAILHWGGAQQASDPSPRGAMRDRLRRVVEGDLLPRLLLQHRAGPVPPNLVARAARILPRGEFDRFLEIVRTGSTQDTLHFLEALISTGHPVEAVYADLLTPTARHLGELWEEDECNFVEVTLVCSRLQQAVRRLGQLFREGSGKARRGRVLVTCLAGEAHSLGAILVAEVLARDGWEVALGHPFQRALPEGDFDLICLSLAQPRNFAAAREMVGRLRAERGHGDTRVLVGGGAFTLRPDLVGKIDADGWAEDALGVRDLADGF